MSLIAFTFGSLGDIIALLQLADQVRRTLCDTRGASAEYRDLIAELDSVVYTITNVQRVLSIQGPRRLAQSVENALYHAVGVCLHLVAQMNEHISTRRRAACGRGVVRIMVADVWQSIGWTLFKREEVLFLRKRLSGQVSAMNTLLTLAQSDQLDHVGDQVSRFHGDYVDESRRQYTLIQEIHRCVTNRPHAMGYTWEAGQTPDNTPIVFTDMFEHTVTLPWQFVETDELLHEFLLFYFRDRPCLELVEWHHYFVVNEDNQSLRALDADGNWQTSKSFQKRLRARRRYQPGSRVDMHGIVDLKFCVNFSSLRRLRQSDDHHHGLTDHMSVFDMYPPRSLLSLPSVLLAEVDKLSDEYWETWCFLLLDERVSHVLFLNKSSKESLFPCLLHSLPHQSWIKGLLKQLEDVLAMPILPSCLIGGRVVRLRSWQSCDHQVPVKVTSSVGDSCK